MTTVFPLGGLLTSTTGAHPNDKIYWRIIERTGDKIRLHPLNRAFTVRGNLIPGSLDLNAKSIVRKIVYIYGHEAIGPVIIGGVVLGLRPWIATKKPMTRGGKRIGAGRKKGSGQGRKSLSRSITLTADEWLRIEQIKGSASFSEFFKSKVLEKNKNS